MSNHYFLPTDNSVNKGNLCLEFATFDTISWGKIESFNQEIMIQNIEDWKIKMTLIRSSLHVNNF